MRWDQPLRYLLLIILLIVKALLIHLIASIVIEMIGWSGCQTDREKKIHLTEKGCNAHRVCLSNDAGQLSMMIIILIISMGGWMKRENCNSSSYIRALCLT